MTVLINTIFLLGRYLHIVCATLLVGGTLFYEMVVPIAIGDLKEEAQLAVFGRARWVFRWIVWLSVVGIILSGFINTRREWSRYTQAETPAVRVAPDGQYQVIPKPVVLRPGWWWTAHATAGALATLIAVFLTTGRQPPTHPVRWMRLDLVVLLTVIFLGVAIRQVWSASEHQEPSSATTQPAWSSIRNGAAAQTGPARLPG